MKKIRCVCGGKTYRMDNMFHCKKCHRTFFVRSGEEMTRGKKVVCTGRK